MASDLPFPGMSLSIVPRYGDQQAKAADAYFTTVVEDLLAEEADGLVPSHYMITEDRYAVIPLRLWEDPVRPQVSMEDHLRLLARVDEAVRAAAAGDGRPSDMEQAIAAIPHHLDSAGPTLHTFVLERLALGDAFTPDEHAELSIGVVDELLVFIRSASFTLVQLGADLYGCAVRGKGSYLIEVSGMEEAGTGRVHHDHH